MFCPLISSFVANLQSARYRVRLEEDGSGGTKARAELEKAAADLVDHIRECPVCNYWIQ